MRPFLAAVALVAAMPLFAEQADKGASERAFQAAGKIWMDLSAGDYDIRAGAAPKIVVTWSGRKSRSRELDVSMRVEGAQAWVETDGARHFRKVTIEVPPRSDLDVKMTAGDLRIEGIEGNKNISLLAGDLDVDVGRTSDYKTVDASLKAGDLNARAFNVSKEGLWRSFTWQGPGRYTLNVSLLAGDLTLSSAAGAK